MKCFKTCLTAAILMSSPVLGATTPPPAPAVAPYVVSPLEVCKMDLTARLQGQTDFLPQYGARNEMKLEDFKALVSVCSVYLHGAYDFMTISTEEKGGKS